MASIPPQQQPHLFSKLTFTFKRTLVELANSFYPWINNFQSKEINQKRTTADNRRLINTFQTCRIYVFMYFMYRWYLTAFEAELSLATEVVL